MGGLALALVVSSLVLFALLGPAILGLASGIAALSALYSLPRFDWKGRPLLSSFAHLAGGMLHFLLGYSLARAIDPRGLAIAAFFALVFAAGHLTQEIRDHQGDAANAVSTNSVTFGQRRTFAASLVLFTVAHILLFAMALAGLIPRPIAALVALYPVQLYWSRQALVGGLTHESVSTLQKRYRVLYSVIGLAMVAALLAAAARIPG
jgi:4-hydroxybenzoate polyprenyltransferase